MGFLRKGIGNIPVDRVVHFFAYVQRRQFEKFFTGIPKPPAQRVVDLEIPAGQAVVVHLEQGRGVIKAVEKLLVILMARKQGFLDGGLIFFAHTFLPGSLAAGRIKDVLS
jgi:hypothetical protein